MPQRKLDKQKIEYYRKALLKLKDTFAQDISNMSRNPHSENSDAGDVSGHVLHMADVATDMYDREFNLGLASNEREVLHRVETALKRLEDDSYGVCGECSKSIPVARLKAIPYVENCLKCQEKIENET